jgi:acyl-CoA thioesterase-2
VTAAVEDLIDLLDLEAIEVNIFRGAQPREENPLLQRVFGGQVAGQALVAAARTVELDRRVHSLHAYFLRPGDMRIPILYEVDHIRDGRSFTTRRVVAIQHGRAIFNLQASFQADEEGYEHQEPMPDVPGPDEVPTMDERLAESGLKGLAGGNERPIELRFVESPVWFNQEQGRTRQHVWFRAGGPLPDDPILHACVVTYASDMTLLDTALLPHGKTFGDPNLMQASLDHAMWFHRPFRADEWLLYAQATPSASGGRGLAQGSIFTADGRLAVSVVQEGLIRLGRR